MAPKFDLTSVWRNVKELDLQRIRLAAEAEIRLVIAGRNDADRRLLAQQLRSDPRRPESQTSTPIPLVRLADAAQIANEDLILYLHDGDPEQAAAQSETLDAWGRAGRRVIILVDPETGAEENAAAFLPAGAAAHKRVQAAVDNWSELQNLLAPRIIDALPNRTLALGRCFPMLRETIARNLITETANANAAYSFSTGLAEIIPVLDIPLNVADMIVLTKAQALLVYKLGLTLGLPVDWQYYITEFSGVIGSGFLWRQVARSLVGLIPAWGIVPKVAVAYSGTYAVGQAVMHWYLTGRHVTRKMLQGFMKEALGRGKTLAKNLQKRLPSRQKREVALPPGETIVTGEASADDRICVNCSTINEADALFCKHCGAALE